MEIAIRDLLAARRAVQPVTHVVMPTGNNFDTDMHARISEDMLSSGTAQIGWQIQPADQTSSYLELWFEAAGNPVDLPVLDEEHPLFPNAILFAGPGATVSYEPDAEETALLGYRRGQIADTVKAVVSAVRGES